MNKRINCVFIIIMCAFTLLSATSCAGNDVDVLIYTCLEDYRIAMVEEKLEEKFPDYKIVLQYSDTGTVMSRLASEGKYTDCDILLNIEITNAERLIAGNDKLFADLSEYDLSKYDDAVLEYANNHKKYHIWDKEAGCIILNTKVLEEKGLNEPENYADLLKDEYKGLIMMPNPSTSGTGYYFYNGLVSSWGKDKALDYFKKLNENIKEFSSSGSGPVKALDRDEIGIGLGMTFQAVEYLNKNDNLKIKYFEEGSPYTMYVMTMIRGRDEDPIVKEVYDYLYSDVVFEDKKLYCPDKIYKDEYQPITTMKQYPENIKYTEMKGLLDPDYKSSLLDLWKW